MNFYYYDSFKSYADYLDVKVTDCLCKHICRLNSEKAVRLKDTRFALGDYNVFWGYGESLYKDPEKNRLIQLSRIQKFIFDHYVHTIRCIIDKDGDLHVDNLHSALAHVIAGGKDITLRDMPVFILDTRSSTIADEYHIVHISFNDINNILCDGNFTNSRMSSATKSVGYTIGEFMTDNDISRDALTLEGCAHYHEFMQKSKQLRDNRNISEK